MKRGHYILAVGLCVFASLCGCGKKEQKTESSTEEENVSVNVLDNDKVTLIYTGYDKEADGMTFTVSNKTGDPVNIYFGDVAINGETVQPLFGPELEANATEEDVCMIECDKAVSVLNGILFIDNDAGETVGRYEVKDVPLSGKAEASGDQSFTLKDGAVQVFDNDKITIAYTGIETDGEGEDAETCLAFEIYNKTDELIQATFDTILVNGTDEEPSYMTEALGHTYGKLLCDVTDPASIKELTASVSIYTAEDELIDSYSIEKAALK